MGLHFPTHRDQEDCPHNLGQTTRVSGLRLASYWVQQRRCSRRIEPMLQECADHTRACFSAWKAFLVADPRLQPSLRRLKTSFLPPRTFGPAVQPVEVPLTY